VSTGLPRPWHSIAAGPVGDYNAKIDQRIAEIKSTCNVQ
jgi:hypothetical protein